MRKAKVLPISKVERSQNVYHKFEVDGARFRVKEGLLISSLERKPNDEARYHHLACVDNIENAEKVATAHQRYQNATPDPITSEELNLQLLRLITSISANANAYDDDMADTWETVLQEWEIAQMKVNKYIGENS